jgi:type I restriction enzyme, S subunit
MKVKSVPLAEIATINPAIRKNSVADDELVAFVPMASVTANPPRVEISEILSFSSVKTGFTYFQDGDILVAKITPCFENGKIAQARIPQKHGFGSTEFHVVRPIDDQSDARYILHFLRQSHIRIDGERNMTGSAGQRRVPKHFLATLKIPLPPIATQKKIAAILDQAEALRSLRRQSIEQLDALARSVFLEMFGDPVTNPKGWRLAKVSDFVSAFETGKNIVAEDAEDIASDYRVLKVSAVTSLEYKPEASKAAPIEYQPPASHFVRKGDLLFSRANTTELIGATAYVFDTPKNVLLPDKIWRFVWNNPSIADPLFVWFLFRHPKVRHEVSKRATGTSDSMKNISQDKVFGITLGLPPLTLQQQFADRIQAIETLKTHHRQSLATMDTLFNSLQHRAFRGEL